VLLVRFLVAITHFKPLSIYLFTVGHNRFLCHAILIIIIKNHMILNYKIIIPDSAIRLMLFSITYNL
jgi:hypothetical protein